MRGSYVVKRAFSLVLALVAAGYEQELAVRDLCEGSLDIFRFTDIGRIFFRSAQNEEVVHVGKPFCFLAVYYSCKAFLDKGFFLFLGVDQQKICVAHLGVGDGLAGAGGGDLHGVAVSSG